MKIGIRSKLMLLQYALIMILVVGGLVFNSVFLEKYYVSQNKALMMELYEQIAQAYAENPQEMKDLLYELDRAEGVSITIADRQKEVQYLSSAKKTDKGNQRVAKELEPILDKLLGGETGSICYTVVEKSNNTTPKIVLAAITEQKEFIILTKGMKGIRESADIANRFYCIIGFFMILVGAGLTLMFSRYLTRSLIHIEQVSNRIARLDFSSRVQVKSNDEIGDLAQSINEIAEKLSDCIAQLQQNIANRKHLVRDISHELKTPIGVIKGYAEGLQHGVAKTPEKAQKYCVVIAKECDRMDRMVQEMLELSRLEDAATHPQKKRFTVISLFNSLAERFADTLNQNNLCLETGCSPDFMIFADYEWMERAVGNFLTNAIRHSEPGSRIRLIATQTAAHTQISVWNAGLTLTEKELERVWEVFYKKDDAHRRTVEGHGVGLAIVRSIAEAHGGRAIAQSTPDGMAFTIEIPNESTIFEVPFS